MKVVVESRISTWKIIYLLSCYIELAISIFLAAGRYSYPSVQNIQYCVSDKQSSLQEGLNQESFFSNWMLRLHNQPLEESRNI